MLFSKLIRVFMFLDSKRIKEIKRAQEFNFQKNIFLHVLPEKSSYRLLINILWEFIVRNNYFAV